MPVASRDDDFQKLLFHADSERNLHLPGSSEPLKANNGVRYESLLLEILRLPRSPFACQGPKCIPDGNAKRNISA